ncbi:hypothetical protein CVO74_04535 [Xanthomonas prunicola]|uniref:Uncharacterized protein n=1 Tax=Xanthomonas prunicola TaxID=2053930 RepID=A0A2N3RQB9_9XANT|nr:hypothetical protein XpruCFBP8353_01925 [Xanthomonas prunicola]PKV18978.1 hypothetical protein XpruCFBP8354_01925 [Xanthomonas prunicola]PKV23258.1 hypothetical protein CVO74_04535 [Xanthomonas prunicola]
MDKCAQAPACNAVKMGGEKMTNRLQETFFVSGQRDPGRIGKVLGAGIAATCRRVVRDVWTR